MTRFDQMVDARMGEIREVVRSGVTERVGRVKRDPVTGDAIGRMGGGLVHAYPEINRAGLTPGRAADAIERGKGKPFLRLRKSVEREIEKHHARPKKRSPEKPTVPPHDSLSKKCKHCKVYHGKSAHRFHGPGAYHQTHLFSFAKNPPMTKEKAKVIFATHMAAARRRKLTRYELDQLARARQSLRVSRRPVMNPRRRKNPVSEVAQTIYRQLGGGRFVVMTGAKNLVASENSLTFKLPLGAYRAIRIELSPLDTYTVTFYNRHMKPVKELANVYNDQLVSVIELNTGLRLSLRNPKRKSSKSPRRNPPGGVTRIYGRVLRIEAQKTGKHACDAACKKCGHRYYHDFRKKPSMFGLPDGSILIKE